MDTSGKSKEPVNTKEHKGTKTKRGYGKKNRRKNKLKMVDLTLVGTNAAGIKSKMESFYHTINKFKPSVFMIQETKQNKKGLIKVPGYQIFEKVRENRGGGGLLTCIDEDLDPVLVANCNDDVEILTVEAKLGDKKVRIINGYGPQEDDDLQDVIGFWQELEGEVIRAKNEGCYIIIEMDANAKVGRNIIKQDRHDISSNGRLLIDFVERQGLVIGNTLDICKGVVTREREFENKVESSTIDYIIVCEELSKHMIEIMIDEERIHTLSRYYKRKIVKSDHNILFCKFSIKFNRKARQIRNEHFNFKCMESKQLFYEETNSTKFLSSSFKDSNDILKCSDRFFKNLDKAFHKCFKKVRIRSGQTKYLGDNHIQEKLNLKTELQLFLVNNKCMIAQEKAKKELEEVEIILMDATADKNAKAVRECIEEMETEEGTFENIGFWKIKKKLSPARSDPPMGKYDFDGNLVTSPEGIKNLYIETYKTRLKNREMKPELLDLYWLKTELWLSRLEYLKEKRTAPWNMNDLEFVLKGLKNNKCIDPVGMINEIFKNGCIGQDLKEALLMLFNGIKDIQDIPPIMTLANITTIFKNKGSKLDLENDRGIFILTVMKKILDRLIYVKKYDDIDRNMTDSNIGARKQRSIRYHLMIIHGIINSVVKGNEQCIDIQIYDLEKAFDALWLEDCLNDAFDNLSEKNRNNQISLLYETNKTNMVAVKTPFGLTKRVYMPNIVQQGGTRGPLLCSNAIDKIGKKCKERNQHFYLYKNVAKIFPLAFVDDLSAIAKCGFESKSMNTFLTTQIEMKKLRFHTTGKNGRSKCVKMHVGKHSEFCPSLKVHGTVINKVTDEMYLGDLLSSDGKNTKNIRNRISKGIGLISQIMNLIESVSFGPHYFDIAMLLRESVLVNGVTTNAEVWHNVSESEISEFDKLDKLFFRRLLSVPKSTPIEAFYLELGAIPMGIIIKSRRVKYLHNILHRKPNTMLSSFFTAQCNFPCKGDWIDIVKSDLDDLELPKCFNFIKSKSKGVYKKLIKEKTNEYALKTLQGMQDKHSKMKNLNYSSITMQNYFKRRDLDVEQKKTIFKFRTRMSEFGDNFRGGREQVLCPLCDTHVDKQELSYECKVIQKEIDIKGSYQEIYSDNININTVKTLQKILETRKRIKENGKLPVEAHVTQGPHPVLLKI